MRKGLKICCFITAITVLLLVVICVSLAFTVFKPKEPEIIPHPSKLQNVEFQLFPLSLNATLDLKVTIENRNEGSFRFKNATTYVNYHDTVIAEIPIEEATVPAKGEINISTYANITADKLILNPHFWEDIGDGRLNLTSNSNFHGKVSFLKIFKFGAKVFSSCNISVNISSQGVDSTCNAKIKL